MADIIDFTQKKLEKDAYGIWYVMDQHNRKPLAFIADRKLFLCPHLAREIRFRGKWYEFFFTQEDTPKILIWHKRDKWVWIWMTKDYLNSDILEELFPNTKEVDQIHYNLLELGYAEQKFDSKEDLVKTLNNFSNPQQKPDKNLR
jgi:hypothetical protein